MRRHQCLLPLVILGSAALLSAQPGGRPAPPARRPGPAAAKPGAAAAATAGEAGLTLGVPFGPPRGLRPLAAESSTLPNGLRLVVAENRELPQVNLYLIVAAGGDGDPEGKTGLAELTARSVRTGGTASLSPLAFEELAGRAGATIDARVNDSRAQFSVRIPSSRLADFAPAFRDLVTAPLLDADAVDLAHGRMLDEVALRATTLGSILDVNFRRRLFAGTAAGRFASYETLEQISRSEVEAFHRQRYVPSRSLVAVEGDLSVAEAKELAARLFGDWKPQQGSAAAADGTPAPAAASKPTAALLFADHADWRNSGIVMGHRSSTVADADLAAMQVLCEIFATGPDSRLARRVKESGGWRAEWNAAWEPGYRSAGSFVIRGIVEGPYTTQALQIIRSELEKLRSGQVTDQEVEQARGRTISRVAVRAQSSADQLLERALYEFYGLPGDQLTRTYQSLLAVTKADVVRAAARQLLPEQVMVVAGSSTLFDRPLTEVLSKVEPIDLTVPAPRAMKPRTDPESILRAKQALARWQQAMGGREKLAAIKQLYVQSEGTTILNNAPTPIKLIDRWREGDTYRQDQEFSFSKRAVFYNGKIGWVGLPGVVGALSESILYQIRGELFRLPFRLALSDENPARQVAHLGGNSIQVTEGEAYGLRVYFDPATGLPQRIAYRIPTGGGASVSVEETYGEWKEFGGSGIKWPSRINVKRNGRRTDELAVTEVKFNSGAVLAEMEKKP